MMLNQQFSEQLGKIIKYHRQKSGLNRLELAHLAEVGKTAIFDIEHGKKTVRLNTLLQILKVLNIQIELNSPLMKHYEEEKNEDS